RRLGPAVEEPLARIGRVARALRLIDTGALLRRRRAHWACEGGGGLGVPGVLRRAEHALPHGLAPALRADLLEESEMRGLLRRRRRNDRQHEAVSLDPHGEDE